MYIITRAANPVCWLNICKLLNSFTVLQYFSTVNSNADPGGCAG